MSNTLAYNNTIAFHPGYYVKEMMEEMNINQKELAQRLDTTTKTVSELVNGNINLSEEMVLKLSSMFGTSIELWLNLDNTYKQKKLEKEKLEKQEREYDFLKCIDCNFLKGLGLLSEGQKKSEIVNKLHELLNISTFDILNRDNFLVQYKAYGAEWDVKQLINANIWVQIVIGIGEERKTAKYDEKKLKETLHELRKMTVRLPNEAAKDLEHLLADCGIAFVVTPKMKHCNVTGAVKWLDKDKAVLAMNDRMKSTDVFWFSLFHELQHVMQKRIKLLIVNTEKDELIKDNNLLMDLEREADLFARDFLIPAASYTKFVSEEVFTVYSIISFSEAIGIHPGIVVGRLQKDGHVGYDKFNEMKMRYSFNFEDVSMYDICG